MGILFTLLVVTIVSIIWANSISKTNWDEHKNDDFLN